MSRSPVRLASSLSSRRLPNISRAIAVSTAHSAKQPHHNPHPQLRQPPFTAAMSTTTPPHPSDSKPAAANNNKDWSPDQYLLFRDARNRPTSDLITFLGGADYAPTRITDLGCGPGNSTELLAARFPHARISGMDSSPAMLAKARAALPRVEFTEGDVRTYVPEQSTDLLFSNAVFHWLRREERIPAIVRLLLTLPPTGGGVLAFQVPDNYTEPSHRLMRETASTPGQPWSKYFAQLAPQDRPDLDPIEPPLEYYNALIPHCRAVETWTTRYVHVLDGPDKIVEWVRGTGLQPFLHALPSPEDDEGGGVRAAFLEEYERRLAREYPRAADGKVLLTYPRRFVVAFR